MSRPMWRQGMFVIAVSTVSAHEHLLSLGYTEKAVVSARAARKKRWICFGIAVVIIIIIVIVIVVEVRLASP